jgi:hypothetical protein
MAMSIAARIVRILTPRRGGGSIEVLFPYFILIVAIREGVSPYNQVRRC